MPLWSLRGANAAATHDMVNRSIGVFINGRFFLQTVDEGEQTSTQHLQ
jgi:hypothetical protein